MGKSGGKEIIEVVIDEVFADQAGLICSVVLRERGGKRRLSAAVDFKCVVFLSDKPEDSVLPLPGSRYEFIGDMIHKLGGEVNSAVIDDSGEDYYIAKLYIKSRYGYDLGLDFEVGDAIAICHFFKVPIYVTKDLLLKITSGVWDSEDDGRSEQPESGEGTAMPAAFGDFIKKIDGLDDLGKK